MPRSKSEPHDQAWKEWCKENKIKGGEIPQWISSLGSWAKGIAPDLWKEHGKDIVKKILLSSGPLVLTALGVPPGLSNLVTNYAVGQVDKITVGEAEKAIQETTLLKKKATTRRNTKQKAVRLEAKRPKRKAKVTK